MVEEQEEKEDMTEEEIAEMKDDEREERDEAVKTEEADYGYPTPLIKPSAFQLFSKVMDTIDSSKTSFLTNEELGGTRLSVRDYQTLGWFAEIRDQKKLAQYLYGKAEVALKTGLSRKGFFMNLAVTQRREMKKPKPQREVNKWTKPQEEA
jgi:hypothetical protein